MAVIFKIITDTPLNETDDRVWVQAFDDATGEPFIDPSNGQPIIFSTDGRDDKEWLARIATQALADIEIRKARKIERETNPKEPPVVTDAELLAKKIAQRDAARASRASLPNGVIQPKILTDEEIENKGDQAKAMLRNQKLLALTTLMPSDNPELAALKSIVDADKAAHPEWFGIDATVKTK